MYVCVCVCVCVCLSMLEWLPRHKITPEHKSSHIDIYIHTMQATFRPEHTCRTGTFLEHVARAR